MNGGPAGDGGNRRRKPSPADRAQGSGSRRREPAIGREKLALYQAKRDFARTPEPAGGEAPGPAGEATPESAGGEAPGPAGEATPESAGGEAPGPAGGSRRFVVQRHRARRRHYDLRFEIDGALVSWAVPNGPTLDPTVKRLAVHVEDHPIEYLDFEGVIPRGEYGGGDVIVWDTGTWEPHGTDDPAAAVAAGELHADVHGRKLRGRLVLVRRGHRGEDSDQWLLLHKDDEYAVRGWDPEDYPESVLSGRTNEQVRADPERMWRSGLPPAQASVALRHRAIPGPTEEQLAALEELGPAGRWEVFGRQLRLTNLDKELFPGRDGEPAVTKRELISYTARIAPVALPYLAGRPLNMHRFPGGADSPGFWQKQLPEHAPDWIPRWRDPDAEPGKTSTYLVADEPAALVWAVNFGAIEWHAWTARADRPDSPTYALIDIDPGTATPWDDVLVLARLHRAALDHLGVRAAVKLTGRRGIHIWIPVAPGYAYQDTRTWTEQLSKAVGTVVPELVSWKWDRSGRAGRARLDYTQNVQHKTLVAPYRPRAAAGAPVSAPIAWDELDDPALRPDSFTIRDEPDRVAERGDLFRAALDDSRRLPPIR
jgi:bifunctional non-homologous end joining protein LigD